MSEEIWTITKTGVLKPSEGVDLTYWQREQYEQENITWSFGSFEGARHAFRGILAGFAGTDSTVFDGKGNIRNLQDEFEEHRRWYDEFGPAAIDRNVWKLPGEVPDYNYRLMAGDFDAARMVPAMLRAWILDAVVFKRNPLPTFRWTDWSLGVISTPQALAIGCTCGIERIELYDSQVYTNAFDMSDPDGDYEFSVRNYLDVYDQEPDRSLRLRLAKGPAREGGHFLWPNEDPEGSYLSDDGPSPCLQGMIDDSESLYIVAHPAASDGSDESVRSFRAFVDDVLDCAEKRGFVVDRRQNPSVRGDLAGEEAHLYQAEGEGAWSHMRLTATLCSQSAHRAEAPIRIGGSDYSDYAEALAGADQLLDDHLRRMHGRRWHLVS